jgi:hypothetical protein
LNSRWRWLLELVLFGTLPLVLFLNSLKDCRHKNGSGLKCRKKKLEAIAVIVQLREDTTSDEEYCLWRNERIRHPFLGISLVKAKKRDEK